MLSSSRPQGHQENHTLFDLTAFASIVLETKILIDSIMRQTIVLIAQLTASAGIRAPIAHLVDEIFLQLSEELDRQGVAQKVAADMFGMALRGYQRKISRLRESSSDSTQTLWQEVHRYIEERGSVVREDIVRHFEKEDPNLVRSLVRDLVNSSLVQESGRRGYGVLSSLPDSAKRTLARTGNQEALETLVWLEINRAPSVTVDDIADQLSLDSEMVEKSVRLLEQQGTVQVQDDGSLSAPPLHIAVGSEAGWEEAVFNHFQAVCVALVTKLRGGATQSNGSDQTGGMTFSFDVFPGHPEEQTVHKLLQKMNGELGALWDRVEHYNAAHSVRSEQVQPVTVYFGQSVSPPVTEDS